MRCTEIAHRITITTIEFSRYLIALLFGTAIAVSFAGMTPTRKNYLVLVCFTSLLFILQIVCLGTWGMDVTIKIYPLLSHFPLVIFIVLYLKRPWLISLTSMFVSYLCCQPSRWIGTVAGSVFDSVTINHIGYVTAVFLMYYLLQKYVVKSVRHLMERSVKSCLLFGTMPALYYLFEYASTVYTDFMYTGTRAAVPFMPVRKYLTVMSAISRCVCIPRITSCASTYATDTRQNLYSVKVSLYQMKMGMALAQKAWFI